jgi:hypothetical protein
MIIESLLIQEGLALTSATGPKTPCKSPSDPIRSSTSLTRRNPAQGLRAVSAEVPGNR